MEIHLETCFDKIIYERSVEETILNLKEENEIWYGVPIKNQRVLDQQKDLEFNDNQVVRDLLQKTSITNEEELEEDSSKVEVGLEFTSFPSILDSCYISLFALGAKKLPFISKLKSSKFIEFLLGGIWNILTIFLGVLLLWLGALMNIPLPLSWTFGVPISAQTFFVKLIAFLLGWKAFFAVLIYILFGTFFGIKIFATQRFGWEVLSSTTGGFLIGFTFASLIIGFLYQNVWSRALFMPSRWKCLKDRLNKRTTIYFSFGNILDGFITNIGFLLISFAGSCVILFTGVGWMAFGAKVEVPRTFNFNEILQERNYTIGLGLQKAIERGLIPFIPGEILKSVLAVTFVIFLTMIGTILRLIKMNRKWK